MYIFIITRGLGKSIKSFKVDNKNKNTIRKFKYNR